MISSPGIGSGLDINSLINQLMSLERQPLQRLQSQESTYNSQLSAFGKLKSALSTFQDAVNGLNSTDSFQIFSATSSNADSFTASADSTAASGSYDLVISQLAQHHKIASASLDPSTALGTGSIDIAVAGNSFNVAIDGSNNTLSGIRNAINNAADNTGVTATIINEGTAASRLVLTADDSGAANSISFTVNDDDSSTTDDVGLSQLLQTGSYDMKELVAAQDAAFTIDTLAITSASNTVTGAIAGVTIDLVAGGGSSGKLTVGRDDAKVTESVQSFVDAYNTLQDTIKEQQKGALKGDSTLRSLANSIRGVLNTAASGVGTYSYLSELGIHTDKDTGSLTLDTTELETALNTDFSGVAALFADSVEGAMGRMDSMLDNWVQTGGLLQNRTDGINSRIDTLQSRMDLLEVRLDTTERRYRDQFSALDALLGQMQSTSSWLSSQLASLG